MAPKTKWVFIPQMSSYFRDGVEHNGDELTAGTLAMERATKFHVKVHIHEAVMHLARGHVPLMYVDALRLEVPGILSEDVEKI